MLVEVGIINKGIEYPVVADGNEFLIGTQYTCTIYRSAKDKESRMSVTVTAEDVGGVPTCDFVFSPKQTAELKTGPVIMEIYDNAELKKMFYKEKFTEVRATSIAE